MDVGPDISLFCGLKCAKPPRHKTNGEASCGARAPARARPRPPAPGPAQLGRAGLLILIRVDIHDPALVLGIFLKKWAVLLKRPAVLLKRPGRLAKRPACACGTGGGF